MARYIDADIVREKIYNLYEHFLETKNYSADGACADCLDFLDDTPTADVVPKSEIEELQTENEELQAKVAQLRKENIELLVSKETDIHISMEKLVKVRTEHPIFKAIEEKVAREIFEEIENRLLPSNTSGEFRGDSVEWFDYFDLHLAEDIAELKKKYLESENG